MNAKLISLLRSVFASAPSRNNWLHLIILFTLVVIGLLVFGHSGSIPFIFDADGYWGMASRFIQNGNFSLLRFDSSLRGYLFSLTLVVPKALVYYGVVSRSLMSILIGALQASLLFGLVLPSLYGEIRPGAVFLVWQRVLFAALGIFFWGGYFNYTLSDFPAILAFAWALVLLLRSELRPWTLVLGGVLVGVALNFRPFFLISLPFVLMLVGWQIYKKRSWLKALVGILLVMAGLALPLLPQWYINRVNFGKNSPLVLAQFSNNKSDKLILLQLGWGLKMQKVETSFGSPMGRNNALVIYRDPLGESMLREAGYSAKDIKAETFKNFSEYFALFFHHPLEIGGIYLSRLFNGLDQHHSTPYIIQPIEQFTWLLPAVNYSLWFGVILIVCMQRKYLNTISLTQLIVLLAWLVPCGIGCIVATENRFLLPLHLLMYAVLCFEWPLISCKIRALNRFTLALVLSAYVGFVAVCFAFSYSVHINQFLVIV